MADELLKTLLVLADTTRQQLEQQLILINTLKDLQAKGGRSHKVANKSSKKSAPRGESEAEKLIKLVTKLCTHAPYSRRELIELTGATESRVKNTLTRLKGDEFPEWSLENLGTERRARWFLKEAG